MRLTEITAYATSTLIGMSAMGGSSGAEFFLIDFEGIPESTPISTQYASLGVTFEIEGEPELLPIIALEGNPRVAFLGNVNDKPMSSGLAGLTDPEVGTDHTIPFDIRMNFDPPADNVRFFYIDLDDAPVTVTAFDGDANVIQTITKTPDDPDTGNADSTEFLLNSTGIASVLIDVGERPPVQYAIDFITFTRPCESEDCAQFVEVAQESAPGAGDFDDNILGNVAVYPTSISPIQFYAYDVPEGESWNGATLTPVADRSHLLLSSGPAEITLFVVHDRAIPNDPDGGEAEMSFEIEGDPSGAFIAIRDDPGNEESPGYLEISPYEIKAGWDWGQCCTDGLAISGIGTGATVFVTFAEFDGNSNTAPIEGLSEWFIYSADGNLIQLALEEDRTVRLRVPGPLLCPADLNGDGIVNGADLGLLLGSWGGCS